VLLSLLAGARKATVVPTVELFFLPQAACSHDSPHNIYSHFRLTTVVLLWSDTVSETNTHCRSRLVLFLKTKHNTIWPIL